MRERIKEYIAAGIIAAVAVVLMIVCTAQAKTVYTGADKDYGLRRKHGNYYYIHPDGEITRDAFRYINGKLYYFRKSGKMQTRDSRYIDIRSRDHSVRYIYVPGTNKHERYNVKEARYQIRRRGRWRLVGMQCLPYGQLDMEP